MSFFLFEAALAANFGHVFSISTYDLSPFSPRGHRFFGREFVSSATGVRCLPALARNLPLSLGIH